MAKNWKAKSELLAAVLGGDSEMVRLILADSPELRPYVDDGEHPLLHLAARQGNAGVVRTLVGAGFDVNAKDGNGMTALLHAVDANKPDSIFPLAEFGADVNACGDDGWAPLHLAVRNDNPIVVAALGWLKADPNVRNAETGATPLHLAAFLDRDELIPQLLNMGADPALEDVNGMTAVMIAAHEGNRDARRAVLNWLLEHDTDEPNSADPADPDDHLGEAKECADGVFTTCDWCGRDIRIGNACLTVHRSIEQVDWNTDLATEEIQVIDSESLLELCATCGNKLDTETLRKKLVAGKRQ